MDQLNKKYSAGTNRLILGFGSNVIGQVITAITSIILVTLFINAWGSTGYGRWLTLFALASYLTLLDLGGQNYIGNLLAKAHVQDDDVNFRTVLSAGLSFYIVLTFLSWIVIIVFLLISAIRLPGETAILTIQDRLVLFALSTLNLLSILAGVFYTIYRASGRLARGTMIGNFFRLISLFISVWILFSKFSPVIFAFGSLIIGIILSIVLFIDSRTQISRSHPITININLAKKGANFLSGSIFFWLISLAGLVNNQGVILILGGGATTAAVALYSTERTAAGLLGYFCNLIQAPLWPEMTFYSAKNKNSELARITLLSIKILMISTGILAIGLWILLPVIYPIWTGHQLNLNSLLLLIFLFQGVLAAGWMTASWPLLASNQHRSLSYWSIANAILTITLAAFLINIWGGVGVALATLLGDVVCGLFVFPRLAAKGLGISPLSFYTSIIWSLLLVIIGGGLLLGVTSFVDGWNKVVLGILMIGLFFLPMLFVAVGKKDLAWILAQISKGKQTKVIPHEI